MPRLSVVEWIAVRTDYEMFPDWSLKKLGEKHGVSDSAIHRKVKTEEWRRDITGQAMALAIAKSKRDVDIKNDKSTLKKREAVEDYAEKIAKVLRRHKNIWLTVWAILHQAVKFDKVDGTIIERDFELLKCAKITSEIITIAQKGERAAWGIDLESPKIQVNTHIKNTNAVTAKLQSRIDWDSIPDSEKAELENLLKSINEKED